eukprot:2142791-Pyramimonas_sp.AAC.1
MRPEASNRYVYKAGNGKANNFLWAAMILRVRSHPRARTTTRRKHNSRRGVSAIGCTTLPAQRA